LIRRSRKILNRASIRYQRPLSKIEKTSIHKKDFSRISKIS
jgi:hypothetical protein